MSGTIIFYLKPDSSQTKTFRAISSEQAQEIFESMDQGQNQVVRTTTGKLVWISNDSVQAIDYQESPK